MKLDARAGRSSRILEHLYEPGLLRQPRLRRRGGIADVLLAARAEAHAARRPRCSRASRRRRRSTTRSRTRGGAGPPQRGAAAHARTGDITPARVQDGGPTRASPQARPAVRDDPRAVLLQLRERRAASPSTARTPFAPAGCGSTRRSTRAAARRASRRSANALTSDRPGVRARRDRSAERRDPRDGGGRRRAAAATSSTSSRRRGARPGSTFKTFVLAAAIAQGIDPDTTLLRSAPFHYRPDPWELPAAVGRQTLRRQLHRARRRSRRRRSGRTTPSSRSWRSTSGRENIAAMAQQLGVETPLDPRRRSIALGGLADGVSPLEMARAPTRRSRPAACYSEPHGDPQVVLANGKVDSRSSAGRRAQRVLSDGVAYKVTKVLEREHALRHGHQRALVDDRP